MTEPTPCRGSGQIVAGLDAADRKRGPIAQPWHPCPVCRERQPVAGSPPAIATHWTRREAQSMTLAL